MKKIIVVLTTLLMSCGNGGFTWDKDDVFVVQYVENSSSQRGKFFYKIILEGNSDYFMWVYSDSLYPVDSKIRLKFN